MDTKVYTYATFSLPELGILDTFSDLLIIRFHTSFLKERTLAATLLQYEALRHFHYLSTLSLCI